MSFRNFFERLFSGNGAGADEAAAEKLQKIRKVDIDVAIAAHKNWRIRLQSILDGTERDPPKPEQISCDKSCDLGKWIHGPGEEVFGDSSAFVELRANHQMFHYCASNVVMLAQSNKQAEARKVLEDEFDKLSRRVELSLNDLKHTLQAG